MITFGMVESFLIGVFIGIMLIRFKLWWLG